MQSAPTAMAKWNSWKGFRARGLYFGGGVSNESGKAAREIGSSTNHSRANPRLADRLGPLGYAALLQMTWKRMVVERVATLDGATLLKLRNGEKRSPVSSKKRKATHRLTSVLSDFVFNKAL